MNPIIFQSPGKKYCYVGTQTCYISVVIYGPMVNGCPRNTLFIITYCIILYLFLILVKNNQLWTENFYFVIAADSQFGYTFPPIERDSTDWKIEMDKAIFAIDKINNLSPRPQFLVVCGDLVNEMPCS